MLIDCARRLTLPNPATRGILPRRAHISVEKAPPPPPPAEPQAQQLFSASALATRVARVRRPAAAAAPQFLKHKWQKRPEGTGYAALLANDVRSGKVWRYLRPAATKQPQQRGGHIGVGAFGFSGGAPSKAPSMLRLGMGR
jgi:hypothetical protein